jgi:hypothetical protein
MKKPLPEGSRFILRRTGEEYAQVRRRGHCCEAIRCRDGKVFSLHHSTFVCPLADGGETGGTK